MSREKGESTAKQPDIKFTSNTTTPNFTTGQKHFEMDDLHMALKSCTEIGSAKTLMMFLIDIQKINTNIPSAKNSAIIKSDRHLYAFLNNAIICSEQNYDESILKEIAMQEFTLNYKNKYVDLISSVVQELLVEKKQNKLQTFGYQLENPQIVNPFNNFGMYQQNNENSNQNQQPQQQQYVKCNFINLNKQCMMTRNWERVYFILGDALFRHVYKEYMIFLKTRDESLVQISGTNIFCYLNDKLGKLQNAFYEGGQDQVDQPKPKKNNFKSHKYNLKSDKDSYHSNMMKSYWDEQINRNRVFYCSHMNRKSRFFQKHLLNGFIPQQEKLKPIEIRDKIFKDYFGFCRMRKELKSKVIGIIDHVIASQKKFNYQYYLSKNCPLPENWKDKKAQLLEDAKVSADSRGKVYKELFEYSTDYRNVADFLSEFVANVFPPDFMDQKNKKLLNKKIFQFVKFNRFETFTRVTLLDRLKVHQIPWTQFKCSDEKKKFFMNENEFVLWRMLKWMFEDLLVTLQRCFFYCTEKQKEYSRLFYYRKNIWNMVMQLSIEDLFKQTLKQVQKTEMDAYCRNNQSAPGKLRLIPKGDTFRPIMTFNRKTQSSGQFSRRQTTNNKLNLSHMMLKNLKSKMFKHSFGFAVFNYDDIMKRYEAFVQKWKKLNKPKLYFVAMDIEKCYDNVDSEKLVQFLQRSDLLEREYFILKCFVLKRRNNVLIQGQTFKKQSIKQYFRYKWQNIGIDGGQYPSLFEILEDEYNDLNIKRTLIVEFEQRKKYAKESLIKPVTDICKNNYITFNKKQFRQIKGIPQGLCVSYILSSFYYANLEENVLGFLRKESQDAEKPEINLLMRLTDDYLLMTTEKNNAMLFIEKLYQLSLNSSFKFNMKKLKTNFVLNLQKIGCQNVTQDPSSIDQNLFNWIGISIDVNNLNIIPNINTKKEGILCTLNTNLQTNDSILWLKKKLKSFLMNNVSFYFKATINDKDFARQTLNKLYISAAEKYVACCYDFKQFHATTSLKEQVDAKIVQILYVVIRSFFKYLVCNIKHPVYTRVDYLEFFKYSLRFFTIRFKFSKNMFRGVYKMLLAKEEKLKKDTVHVEFQIK